MQLVIQLVRGNLLLWPYESEAYWKGSVGWWKANINSSRKPLEDYEDRLPRWILDDDGIPQILSQAAMVVESV